MYENKYNGMIQKKKIKYSNIKKLNTNEDNKNEKRKYH